MLLSLKFLHPLPCVIHLPKTQNRYFLYSYGKFSKPRIHNSFILFCSCLECFRILDFGGWIMLLIEGNGHTEIIYNLVNLIRYFKENCHICLRRSVYNYYVFLVYLQIVFYSTSCCYRFLVQL